MIDAHSHLYSDKFDHDLHQVIQRARESLEGVVISAVDPKSLQKSLNIRRQYPDFIYVSSGVHPRTTARLNKRNLAHLWQAIRNVKDEIVAVGEVGPDFHHIKDVHQRERQLLALEEALALAESLNLPLVVHARQAEEAALEVVSGSRIPVGFHCFSGTRQTAREITSRGFYLSFSAILLLNPELREVAAQMPLELLLTETDSPALSPHPNRRRNEPAFLKEVISCLSELRNCPAQKLAVTTASNARKFYRLPSHPSA